MTDRAQLVGSILTDEEYLESLRDGREIWIDGVVYVIGVPTGGYVSETSASGVHFLVRAGAWRRSC